MPLHDHHKLVVSPLYEQPAPNETLDIGERNISFVLRGKSYCYPAKFVQRFLPRERIELRINAGGDMLFLFHNLFHDKGWDGTVTPDGGPSIPVLCSSTGTDGTVFTPRREPIAVMHRTSSVTTGIVHIFNMPNFAGSSDYAHTAASGTATHSTRIGCLHLRAGGWTIVISATLGTEAISKSLQKTGGWAMTHVAQITRDDGSSFSDTELSEVTQCLHYYLSFALGRWAGMGMCVGLDAKGDRVWEECGLFRSTRDSWHGGHCWFDDRHAESLEQCFPGFWQQWNDPIWHEPFSEAIYWYVNANAGGSGAGVDTGLIIAQAALELLAWTQCVLVKKMVSRGAFSQRGLNAADKLRLLVSSLAIPTTIPGAYKALASRPGTTYADALDALTSTRNCIVHPDSTRPTNDSVYYEAWNLSTWYIEMILLRLCGYNGKYGNRMKEGRWAGQVESVPWAPP